MRLQFYYMRKITNHNSKLKIQQHVRETGPIFCVRDWDYRLFLATEPFSWEIVIEPSYVYVFIISLNEFVRFESGVYALSAQDYESA